MGKKVRLSKEGLNRGAWTKEEDIILKAYLKANGEGKWSTIPNKAGLKRGGKSCRLRWLNYLRPGIKRGNITLQEEDLIIRLHNLLGNKWSLIAGRLPGRTDNEIKNYWNTVLYKKVQAQNDSTDQRATSYRTEVPELIRPIPIRFTRIFRTPHVGTESNSTDSKGWNSPSNGISAPELKSSKQTSETDMQTESWWESLLPLEFDGFNALQQNSIQSDCMDFSQLHASDYALMQ